MADHIRTVPQEKFSMDLYRHGSERTRKCGSVGCVVGHCTILSDEPLPRTDDGTIDFAAFTDAFIGFRLGDFRWNWCFDSRWLYIDNTPTGAALRIEWLINKGLPRNWRAQMKGTHKLCYYNNQPEPTTR